MTAALWVRHAEPDDAGVIVDIISEAFPPWVVERTVYSCAGATAYVNATISGWPLAAPAFLVAGNATDVLSAAEIMVSQVDVFIAYICTRASARSQGLGAGLLTAAVDRGDKVRTITLDVFESNDRARAWYAALGFALQSELGWWDFELPEPAGAPTSIIGLPQADVCHRTFGFSEFTLRSVDTVYRVGRLGSDWFRITDPSALDAPGVSATLAALHPNRRVLVSAGVDEFTRSRLGDPAVRSLRLQASIRDVREGLTRDRK